MYYAESGAQINKPIMMKALTKLGDLLRQNEQRVELVCCGGIVSLLYLGSRQMTHDVDVLFPNNPNVVKMLKTLVDKVGEEFGLEHGPRDKWFNDSISFIGLQSKSDNIVFHHSHLILKAADWHEMLSHKLTAFRNNKDIDDAINYLKEIKPIDKNLIFEKVSKYRPFIPNIADDVFENRFNQIWLKAYG